MQNPQHMHWPIGTHAQIFERVDALQTESIWKRLCGQKTETKEKEAHCLTLRVDLNSQGEIAG